VRFGNSDPQYLQAVFPTARKDAWVAISIRSDADWVALSSVTGSQAWTAKGAPSRRVLRTRRN
jgi:hypothetical protein